MVFENITPGVPDPMFTLKARADADQHPDKVDLGVGIYRNAQGQYEGLSCIAKAKKVLDAANLGHDYELTTGNAEFLSKAARVLLGQDLASSEKLKSVQTISGTGAVHLAALFIANHLAPETKVYVGVPTWGNYRPTFELVGKQVTEFPYIKASVRAYDHESTIATITSAPPSSVFILQACCHNPTGLDPTPDQWNEILDKIERGSHLPLFDIAYQGLGRGMAEDAYAARECVRRGIEAFICQSFSKNFAIYGERCGALHVACKTAEAAANVHDRLRCLIRWEVSSSPAFGSRLVNIVLGSDDLQEEWQTQLTSMRSRIQDNRAQLWHYITKILQVPGKWEHMEHEQGLFSYLPLTPAQCRQLVSEHHIHLPESGRINVSGLSENNIPRVAHAIESVVGSSAGRKESAAISQTASNNKTHLSAAVSVNEITARPSL